MEHVFLILKAIASTYDEYGITEYKPYFYDGINTFISTKSSYILRIHEDTNTLESLHTPYGKIMVCCNFISELDKIFYIKLLSRIKGTFITSNCYVIHTVDSQPIPYPLLKSIPYSDDEINSFYVPCTNFRTNKIVYNSEIERLVSLGIIQDDLGLLNNLEDDHYYTAIDKLFTMKMYSCQESNQFRKTPQTTKYSNILGLLILTDTPIKGIKY